MTLAKTAVAAVDTHQAVHVQDFTDAIVDLYTSPNVWEKAIVGSMCSYIATAQTTGKTFGGLNTEQWTNVIYGDVRKQLGFGNHILTRFGRDTVEHWVDVAGMAYLNPQTLPGYIRACGLG